MAISDHVSGCISELESNWDTGVTPLPEIENGRKQTNEKGEILFAGNFVYVFDGGVDVRRVDPAREYQDEGYNLILTIGSNESGAKRDDISSEVQRILGETGVTNYDNFEIRSIRNIDDSQRWRTDIGYRLEKYNASI